MRPPLVAQREADLDRDQEEAGVHGGDEEGGEQIARHSAMLRRPHDNSAGPTPRFRGLRPYSTAKPNFRKVALAVGVATAAMKARVAALSFPATIAKG